jgi:glycosyltransferase involved in cell wall biosynthesis
MGSQPSSRKEKGMKALLLSHSDGGGGAGRATDRLFNSLSQNTEIDLRMHVDFKHRQDPRVFTNSGPGAEQRRSLRVHFDEIPAFVTRQENPQLFSPGRASAMTARKIDSLSADILNIHWTNYGYLSIETMGKIKTPFVWTLHDMWAVTGGMHYEPDHFSTNTSNYTGIEKWVAKRKLKYWKRPFHVVTPSSWLSEVVKASEIGSSWSITTIPNPLDLELYKPLENTRAARDTKNVIVSLGGDLGDQRKGFDLLEDALPLVKEPIQLLVLGHDHAPADWPREMPPTQWLGYLNDQELAQAYSQGDLAIVPSRQDNLPQTATEATACGLPVVAFNIGGLPDIVESGINGYLATPGDSKDLAHGIDLILGNNELRSTMSGIARQKAKSLWSPKVVAKQYEEVFTSACTTVGR